MSTLRFRRAALAVTAAAVLPLAPSACSSDMNGQHGKNDMNGKTGKTGKTGKNTASGKTSSSEAKPSKGSSAGGGHAMTKPFGPACATVPKGGNGSFDGMAKDPVATAASHHPALSTLVTAVKKWPRPGPACIGTGRGHLATSGAWAAPQMIL